MTAAQENNNFISGTKEYSNAFCLKEDECQFLSTQPSWGSFIRQAVLSDQALQVYGTIKASKNEPKDGQFYIMIAPNLKLH